MIEEVLRLINAEQWEEAEALLNKLQDIPYTDMMAIAEASIMLHYTYYSEALQCITQGLHKNPFNYELYYMMGDIYALLGSTARAMLSYENALFYCKEESDRDIIQGTINYMKQEKQELPKRAAIILVSYNNLAYTRLCVDSIRMHNPKSAYEIVVVDNASEDGSVQWLCAQQDIKVISNNENKGFPAACNQGINEAEIDSDIFLLNNDTVMMANALYTLRMALYTDELTGATGAVSNCVTASQQIKEKFDDLSGYLTYSEINNIPEDSRHEKRIKLIGFAYLIKREVLSKTDLLDENYGMGHYEDDDISLRILQAGYSLILCHDAFIYHFGNRSFEKLKEEKAGIVEANHQYFMQKWKIDLNYYIYARNELIDLLTEEKESTFRVLEVGCACGATLLKISSIFHQAEIYGIELDTVAASIGALCHPHILQGNIEDKNLKFPKGFFDYIIFGDVLEHLHKPEDIIQYITPFLKPEGRIIASIPNVMNHTVMIPLLRGRFEYQNAGILDKTHLKFFTLEESLKLFLQAHCKIEKVEYLMNDMNEEAEAFIDQLCTLDGIAKKELFQVYQFLICAKKI